MQFVKFKSPAGSDLIINKTDIIGVTSDSGNSFLLHLRAPIMVFDADLETMVTTQTFYIVDDLANLTKILNTNV